MKGLQDSKGQALIIFLTAALFYIILARPVEPVTDFEIEGDQVYLTAGPVGLRVLDASDPQSMRMVGALDTAGYANALALQEQTAYIADDRAGVVVVDVRDPLKPQSVKTVNTDAAALDLAIWKKTLYVAVGKRGVQVFRIKDGRNLENQKDARLNGRISRVVISGSRLFTVEDGHFLGIYKLVENDPRPQPVTRYEASDDINGITVDDNRVLLAVDRDGVEVLDISVPTQIKHLAKFNTPGRAMSAVMAGAYQAYVADGSGGLRVWDLQDPANPRQLEVFSTWGNTTQVAIKNDLVFLADGFSGLRVLYATIQVSPQRDGGSPQSNAGDVENFSRYVYVADGERGLRVFDTAVNQYPEVSFLDTPGFANALDLRTGDNRAFLADRDALLVLDISKPEKEIRQVGLWKPGEPGDVLDVKVVGNLAYLAQSQAGMSIVDVTNQVTPTLVGSELTGNATGIDVAGSYAYVASGFGGLHIIDVVDAELPTQVAHLELNGESRDLAVAEPLMVGAPTYVYVAAGKPGLCQVDVSFAENPIRKECFKTDGKALSVAVVESQGRAYVGDDLGNLYVVSIDANNLYRVLGRANLQAPIYQLTVQGFTVFAAAHERGFRVVDFSNLAEPRRFVYDYPPRAIYFELRENLAYVLDGQLGMRILDVANKKKVQELSTLRLPGNAYMLELAGDYAYVANGKNGLQVLNVADPRRPVIVGALNTDGDVLALHIRDQRAYLANGEAGLLVVDISTPARPKTLYAIKSSLPGKAVWVDLYRDDYVFLALQGIGLASIYFPDLDKPDLSHVSIFGKLEGDTQPQKSGEDDLQDIHSFTLHDHYAYVAAGEKGLVILDIQRPHRIEEISHVSTSGPTGQVALYGPLAFLSNRRGGVQIFNCTNLKNPRLSSQTSQSSPPYNALMSSVTWEAPKPGSSDPGAYWLYVADDALGLEIYYAKQSSQLYQMSVYETPGTAGLGEIVNLGGLWVAEQWTALGEVLKSLGLDRLSNWVNRARVKTGSKLEEWGKKIGFTWPRTGASPKAVWTLKRVLFLDVFFLGLVGLLVWLACTAQFVLPVRGAGQRGQAVLRLWAFLFHKHGLLAHLRDGKLTPPDPVGHHQGPGVLLVDLSSALVLQKRLLPRNFVLDAVMETLGRNHTPANAPYGLDACGQALPPARVVGPGLVFTGGNRPLRGPKYDEIPGAAVDLHPQIRTEEITATTRDGIEIRTRVVCLFTLGQTPDELPVAYERDFNHPENLRVVDLEDAGIQNGQIVRRIKGFKDELEPEVQREIHAIAVHNRAAGALPPPIPTNGVRGVPYSFDPVRVFAAAGPQVIKLDEKQPANWSELPLQATIDAFRTLCMAVSFDDMFRPLSPKDNPLAAIRAVLGSRMRQRGVLSFQYAEAFGGMPPQAGLIWNQNGLLLWPAQPLTAPQVLRRRGIKVIYAGFTDVWPEAPEVQETLLDHWRSNWDRKTQMTHEDYDLRARRIRNGAHARAQHEMITTLSRIFSQYPNSREALALQLFHSLEAAAVDPKTRQLLPAEVFDVIKTIHLWLVDDDGPENDDRTMLAARARPTLPRA